MRKIIERFVEYPIYANLIIAVVVLAGVFSFLNLRKAFFPETESRFITVSVFYPGASPVEMEEGVTSRIEEAVRGLVGVKEITSTSVENSANISIETTGEYPINETLMEVKNAVDGVSSLPSAAERPIVSKRRSRAGAINMDLHADGTAQVDLMTLKEYGQRIEEDFLNSGVMSQVTISGFPSPEISVEIKEEQLLRYKLRFDDIVRAIQGNNQDVSGGEIKSAEEELLIRLRSRSADPMKIGGIIIKGQLDGSYIRIRDVAEVKKKFADVVNKSWVNGQPSVSIRVEKLPEEDLQKIDDYAKAYLKEFNDKNLGVKLEVSRSYLDFLQSRLKILTNNGLLGLCLVILALSMFLSTRLSIWVSWGIPFAFLATFIMMNLTGTTLNMMTIFGMILVVGILVDDGIVIAENVYVHFEQGKTPMKAAVDGTMEVLPAVLTSVTTTVIAFTPLLFLSGTMMEMMIQMAMIVIASLVFSLFEAFFVLPAHLGSGHVLSQKTLHSKNKGFRRYTENFFTWMRDRVYQHLLEWLLKWRWAVIGVPFALVLITAGLFIGGHVKNTFFPSVDFDNFEVNVAFTPGDGEQQTLNFLHRFEAAVWEVNEDLKKDLGMDTDVIERVTTSLGSAFSRQESGSHAGSLNVYPIDLERLPISGFDIANRVRMKIGPLPEARKFTVAGRNRWGSPVSIGLMSKNLKELEEAKSYLMKRLEELPDLKDINENVALGKQEVRLELKPKAYFLGLDESSIARQVRAAFYGVQAQRLQVGRDEFRVWVRYPKSGRVTRGQLEKMKIKTSSGEFPLIELADYHLERGPVAIKRFNGSREIRVEAETVDPYASVPDILNEIKANILPEVVAQFSGIRYTFQGQQKYSQEAMKKVLRYFVIAFIFIIFVMIIHFKSFNQTIIVVLMIPLSMLGVIWGHGIHGKPLSIMSLWGMVALTGVIINNAIVFLSKYDGLLVEGKQVHDAIVEAGKIRLRPIILTTLTTTIGLFPLVFSKSVQAQFLIPMAISLAYGVAIGTIFILVFFPILIHMLNDIRVQLKFLWTGVRPSREEVEIAVIQDLRKRSYEERKSQEKNNGTNNIDS